MKLKIALLQIAPADSLEANLRKGTEYCRRAKALGADIALFPEMWSCGYTIPEDIERLKGMAISADSEFVSAFGKLAAELEMAIAVTFLEQHEPLPRNTVCLFDRSGSAVTATLRFTPVISATRRGWTREMNSSWLNWIPLRA